MLLFDLVAGAGATLMWVSLQVVVAFDGIVDRWVHVVWVGLELDGVVVVDRF